jgi:hypothetical protein
LPGPAQSSAELPSQRLNQACAIANRKGLYRLKNITAILQSNRDKLQEQAPLQAILLLQDHDNIRGSQSFH